ncbi:MAG TPA: FHA domain-containing serine/threonine-protein kinase [Planctomycetota bacterium]|nr:FHA domain-containing serine/threonine-protein kinase [Planctomycetota bacterium]
MKVTLTVTAGPARGQTFVFDQPDCFLFGRTKDARVSLPNDPYVSRQHFLLEVCPPNCRITDLESKNGTFVNNVRYGGRKAPDPGVRVAPGGQSQTRIENDDEIAVGDTRMRVSIETAASVTSGSTVDIATAKTVMDATVNRTPLEVALTVKVDAEAAPPQDSLPVQRTVVEQRSEQQTIVQDGPESDGPAIAGEIADILELDDAPPIPGYRLESVLGQGGMGKVYKATDLKNGREVAIKALIPRQEVSFNNYRAFNREIEVTRQLFHPNIVEFIGVGKVKGAYFCVLEFVKGTDLRRYVHNRGGRISLQEAAPLMLQTLDGLGYAHRKTINVAAVGRTSVFKGIVHRDLKPENILLQQQGNTWIPKVADFGLSKSYESAGMTDMTMAGVAGTPAYWPREQITHYRYLHPATDVFSIAAVFYEALTGDWARPGLKQRLDQCRAAGRSPQISDYIRVIGDHPIDPIRSKVPSIPQKVADVIDRALLETEVPVDESEMRRILTELRYRDAGVFRDALAAAFEECGIRTS